MRGLKQSGLSIVITGGQDIFEQFDVSIKRRLAAGAVDNFKVFYDDRVAMTDNILSVIATEQTKEADIFVVEKISEINDKEILVSRAAEIKNACKKAGNTESHIYGYFLLPDNGNDETGDEAYGNAYAVLQRIEYHMMFEERAFQDVILISGDGHKIQEWLIDAVMHFSGKGDKFFSHHSLYSGWRKIKGEYLSSADILSGGLVKSTVLPEDSHSYCSLGYAYAELTGGSLDIGTLGNVNQQLFSKENGVGWIRPGADRIKESLIEQQRQYLLGVEQDEDYGIFIKRNLITPLEQCSELGNNPVGLTRVQINAGETKAYADGFNIEERVKKGICIITENIQCITKNILDNAEQVLEEYGPGIIEDIFYGVEEKQDVAIFGILSKGFEQLKKVIETKKRRPIQQIVGALSEKEIQERINEWKYYFDFAVKSEIRAKVASHFVSEEGEWDKLVVAPLERFAKACSAMVRELDKGTAIQRSELAIPNSEPISEKKYVINLADSGYVSEWLKEQTPDHIQPTQLRVLKEDLIGDLLCYAEEGKKPDQTVSERIVNSIVDKKVTLEDCFTSFSEEHTEDEMKDMIRQFVNNCFAQLLDKSVPVLRAGGEERYRRQWILFPKKMLESGYGETLMAEMKSYLDRNGGSEYSIVGTEAQEIVCYQSVLAIPLYELDGLWKWEQCYNKKIETKTLDWKHYFPLALRHLNRNTVNKKFYEEFFSPCIDYALKEKIIERKRFPGEEWKYLYVMNLIPDSWTNLNVSNYKVGDAEGRAQKGEAFFQYLHSMNSFSADVWQREITLPDAGVFSRAYDFSDAPEGMDIDGISISYMKRILQKNVPLFVLLRQTVKKYMRMQRDIDELRIAPTQTGKQAPEDTGMHRTEKPLQTDPPVVKKMKYCKFCGKELKTGVEKFCSKCGRQLRE